MDTNPTTPRASSGTTPQRYIRTFANDMDIYQKGGMPGLAPLKSSPPPPETPAVPGREPLPIPGVVSAPPPPMMIHKPMTPFQAPAERLIEASPIQEEPIIGHQALAVEPAPLLPPLPPEEFEKPNPIETYSQDFRARMKDMRASTATVLAAEQDSANRSLWDWV